MPEKPSRRVEITLLPEGRKILATKGETVLLTLRQGGIDVSGSCGGEGRCGECKVRFAHPPPVCEGDRRLLRGEEIKQGWRLACLHCVKEPVSIYREERSGVFDAKAQMDAVLSDVVVDPRIEAHYLRLPPPQREDQDADLARLFAGLGEKVVVPLPILRKLPHILRDNRFALTVVQAGEDVLDLRPRDCSKEIYGVAIDVGTTTLAAYLLDLSCGKQLALRATGNPQAVAGADVITRIGYVQRRGQQGLEELQDRVIAELNGLISDMASEAGIPENTIYETMIVGNPTMLHLLLGIDPSTIGYSPYVPVLYSTQELTASEIGLRIAPFGKVRILPAVSAYLGADVVAGLLYADVGVRGKVELFLDIGTNGEIVLAIGDRLVACSAAAGPAFEGASICQGMSALAGAIDHVFIDDADVCCSAIGGVNAIGICGSGLVDTVAELRRVGLIDCSGRLRPTQHPLSSRIEGEGAERRFLLTDKESPVCITQKDIRSCQLAKGAIRAGVEAIFEHAHIKSSDLDRVLIGGAFGCSLRPESLLRTGVLPRIAPHKISLLGNSAGQGAKIALCDRKASERLRWIVEHTEYVELSYLASFPRRFVNHMGFPADRELEQLESGIEARGGID